MIWIVEIIGYIASILVAISLMMRNILKLRIINMAGALIFVLYGLIINAYPVFAVNMIIMVVNIYFLLEIITKKSYFSVLNIESKDSPFLQKFVNYYNMDIKKFFPDFELDEMVNTNNLLILRNMIPVGIFISRPINNSQLEILIDYVIPAYRDFKNAHFLYTEESKKYKIKGYHTFITHTKNGVHRKYLLKIGYVQDPENKERFKKKI